ncbi:MAG TPA: pyridoxal phosphate-dependent aminotransferase [bacterium]|nr:pyridoxal phosphate-dependent aminotransferase [bacterium]HQM85049.1 pyridoxal phosphate-dependent aminotransferase [bacterium]
MRAISTRGKMMPPSPIRKLKPYDDRAREAGRTVYHLNIGQPDIETPKEMLDVLKNIGTKIIGYGPSQGIPEYQDALIKYYAKHGINLGRENVIVTTGGSEAIIMAFTVCLNPGDEVLIPEPFYTNYNGFATATDVKVVPVTTMLENDWEIPAVEEIEKLVTERTKAIMICNPNNPTGKVYSRDELKKIVDLAMKKDLFIFADEVYREFIFNGEKHVSLLSFEEARDRVIMMDSISKRFSSCGARIGAFISYNCDIMKAALAYGQARLCPPTIDQIMAVKSVDLDENYYSQVVGEYKKRRDVVLKALEGMEGVEYRVPNGAFYIVIKLPVKNAEDFIIWLLTDFHVDNETVMLAPAEGFYSTPGLGRNEARIAFVLNEQKTERAMMILKKGLEKYKSL